MLYIMGGRIDFTLGKEPILRLDANFLWQLVNERDFQSYFDVIYSRDKHEINVFTRENEYFTTQQERKEGINSLLDLEKSFMFFSSSSFFANLNEKKVNRFMLNLNINDRSIYFPYLIPIEPTKKMISKLREFDINLIAIEPVFFDYNLKVNKLKGFSKSLRNND